MTAVWERERDAARKEFLRPMWVREMRVVDMTMQPKGTLEAFALHAVGGL
jgi:hypothetical protein